MSTKKKTVKPEIWPKVEKGSHLTVYYYEDGSTNLEWDFEALNRDINNAILKYQSNISADSKAKTRKKKVS